MTLVALIALAWLVLWVWERSPSGRFLRHAAPPAAAVAGIPSHDGSEMVHTAAGHGHNGTHHGEAALPVVVAGWTLMTAAMMLPTTLPLLALFHGITRRRPDRPLLVALLIAGYLAVWALFGVAAHAGDHRLRALVEGTDWLARRESVIGASLLIVAGLYQFTPLKYHCLDRCRTPLGFIMGALAGPAGAGAGVPSRPPPRPLLRRLLLVADAADVRRQRRQPRLDAPPRRGDGDREEPPLGPPPECAARRHPAGFGRWLAGARLACLRC